MSPSPEREGRLLPIYTKSNKGKTKEKALSQEPNLPEENPTLAQNVGYCGPEPSVVFFAKDKVFLGKLYLDRWRYWEATKAQHLSGGRGAGSSIPAGNS